MNSTWQGSRNGVVLSLLIAAALYLGAIALSDGPAVVRRFATLSPWVGLALLALPAAAFVLRFIRWEIFIGALGHRLPRLRHLGIYLAGFALTTTPGKVGENLRAVYLRDHGVPVADSFGAFVAERLGDLVAVLLLAGLSVRLLASYSGFVAVSTVATIVGLLVLRDPRLPGALGGIGGSSWLARLARGTGEALAAARSLLRLRLLLGGVGLALVAWATEALTFVIAARAIGVDMPVADGVGVYALATLVGALSFLPGGVGPTEAVLGGLLVVQGGTVPEATAITVLVRAATLWWSVAIGIAALAAIRGGAETGVDPGGAEVR